MKNITITPVVTTHHVIEMTTPCGRSAVVTVKADQVTGTMGTDCCGKAAEREYVFGHGVEIRCTGCRDYVSESYTWTLEEALTADGCEMPHDCVNHTFADAADHAYLYQYGPK